MMKRVDYRPGKPRRAPTPRSKGQSGHWQSSLLRRIRRWTERVCGEITFSTAARQASIVFAVSLVLGPCGWSPSFAQQPDRNWMREYVQLRVLKRNLRAVGAQTARLSGTELRSVLVPRIVGGTVAGAADNPFQVALLRRNTANNQDAQFCGGTLVRENIVVTAAHCSDFVTADQVQVLTGTRRLDGTGDRRDVSRIVIHPAWDADTFDNDVAVWELSTNATGIALATLATEEGPVGSNLLATGWGETEAGPPPIELRRVEVPLVTEENCNDANSYNGAITDTMLCAGLDLGGRDTCQGDSGGPLTRGTDNSVLTGITSWGFGCADPNLFGVYTRVSNTAIRSFIEDNLGELPTIATPTDIALVRQTPGWGSIPVAFARGDGNWNITNGAAPNFIPDWAHQPGVRVVTGDFNGDGLADIALVRQTPGWGSIPIAFAVGDGTWRITNGAAPNFIPNWAAPTGVRVVTGDFNGDGLADIALVRQTPGWGSIPVAFARGDGNWNITNGAAPNFIPDWAHQPGVRVVTGDFNGDGLADIALVRQTPGWGSIPIAFAVGDGTWRITNGAAPNFIPDWAHQPGVRVVTGDFNGNGLTDIALVRQTPGWGSIPVAFARGDGNWDIANGAAPNFIPDWAHQPGVRVVTGDFNGNGLMDIALVRQTPGWGSIPVAFSRGDGNWDIANGAAPNFIPDWAHQPGVRVVTGDFNRNGLTDIALVRQTPGWGSIPIAFARGDGNWDITNGAAPNFIPDWAHQPGVRVVTGDFHGSSFV